jgi:hypothetical protein
MSYIGAQPTTAAFPFDQFSGNGSTTAFTMSYAPASTTSMVVCISGVVQNPNTYSISGLTLTFSPAPPTGTNNIAVLYLGIPATSVVSPGNTAFLTTTSFTATGGQTTFTPSATYQVGFINVIRNGSQLAPADFTATNGTTVVLANACVAGDTVVTQGYALTSLTNALPLTGGTVTGNLTVSGTLTASSGIAVSSGGTGQTSYTDGQLLIGNSTGNTLNKATLTAGSGVTITNGAGAITIAASSSGGGFSNIQVFTSSGTFTVPAGITKVKVTVVGGGGGGGAGQADPTGGGGGGGTAIEIISGLTPGGTVTVTVGAAGASGGIFNTGLPGGTGGTSSFGAFCSATGGSGSAGGNSGGYLGGAGGLGSGGDLNIRGGTGSFALSYGNCGVFYAGGPGGSSFLSGGGNAGAYGGGALGVGVNTNGSVGAAGVVVVEY